MGAEQGINPVSQSSLVSNFVKMKAMVLPILGSAHDRGKQPPQGGLLNALVPTLGAYLGDAQLNTGIEARAFSPLAYACLINGGRWR